MRGSAVVLGTLSLATLTAAASTTIGGGNLGTQTWTLAGSPYIVQGASTSSGRVWRRHGNVIAGIRLNSGLAGTVAASNCIVTGNGIGVDRISPFTMFSLTYSDVSGSTTDLSNVVAGAGCISQDPLYMNAPTDFRLAPGSPCIDAGTSSGLQPNHDYDGALRPTDGDGANDAQYDAYESPCNDAPAPAVTPPSD